MPKTSLIINKRVFNIDNSLSNQIFHKDINSNILDNINTDKIINKVLLPIQNIVFWNVTFPINMNLRRKYNA